MATDITIRSLHTLDEFHRCVAIAREIWRDDELDTEPYITFVIAHHTGGQVLGAFDGDTLVGFTKALVGLHDHTPYLHSHMTGVLASHRDRRIGRLLKLFQREDALRRGIRLVEWTFDPLETRNAHFNLNRLGGICRTYIPNFYGITTSPLHRGLPTDRLLVEWHLDSPRVIAAINELSREPSDAPALIHLPAPGTAGLESGTLPSPGESASQLSSAKASADSSDAASIIELQSRVRAEFTQWFAKSYAVTGIRFTASGADYCLSPWSDF